ncbi:MAG: DUF2066 domain-containing protein [Pseudobdellovibrionaceae bacterium]|jgi:hypothetical protein|nr:DUF2066 domain-containing protein [Pseudobdellovibrionaceae bacterium]
MSRIAFSLLTLAMFCVSFLGNAGNQALNQALAQTAYSGASNGYAISNVEVDVTDNSSVKARDKAFVEAQSKAFRQLAERFGRADVSPSPEMLSSLVQDFEIEKEQLSSKRYRGSFTIRFRESAVNSYFGSTLGHDTGYQAVTSKSLILPFMQVGKENLLWQKDRNYFWQAISSNPLFASNAYNLPVGNVSDSTDVWERDPNVLSMSSIRKIKERYGVTEVIVASFREEGRGQDGFRLDLYRTDMNRVDLVKTIPFSAALTSTDQTVYTKAASILMQALSSGWKPVVQNYGDFGMLDTATDSGEGTSGIQSAPVPEHIMGSVTHSPIVQQREAGSTGGISFATQGNKSVKAIYHSVSEWGELQKTLKKCPSISGYRILAVKVREAELSLSYADWPAVIKDLASYGYRVQMSQDGNVTISK